MSDQPMTVTEVVTGAGQLWSPGEQVSKAAAAKINPDKLVPLASLDKHAADDERSAEDGAEWYNHRTVRSVLDGVGSDPDRARYAIERERERPEAQQRSTLIEKLATIVTAGSPDPDDQGEEE